MKRLILSLLSAVVLSLAGVGCGGGEDVGGGGGGGGGVVQKPIEAADGTKCEDFGKLFNGPNIDAEGLNNHWQCHGSLQNLKLYSDGTGAASFYKERPIRMHWELLNCTQFKINPDPNQDKLVGEVWGVNKFVLVTIARSDYVDTLDLTVRIGNDNLNVFCKRVPGQY